MSVLTPSEVEAAEARANAATEGPWSRSWIAGAIRHINRNVDDEVFWFPTPEEKANIDTVNHPLRHEGDYDFIAHARSDVPRLCEALREAWKERDFAEGRWLNEGRATPEELDRLGLGMRHSYGLVECSVCQMQVCRHYSMAYELDVAIASVKGQRGRAEAAEAERDALAAKVEALTKAVQPYFRRCNQEARDAGLERCDCEKCQDVREALALARGGK